VTSAYRRVLDRISREPGQLQHWSFPVMDRPRVEELISRGLLEVIKAPVKRDSLDRPIETLGITEAGRGLLHPPMKLRKAIPWRREPKGPGFAEHVFTDAGGERVELLVYDCPPSAGGARMCGFEIYARNYRGRYFEQVAAGEADSIEEAKAAVHLVRGSSIKQSGSVLSTIRSMRARLPGVS
jgi:hypothetical protein